MTEPSSTAGRSRFSTAAIPWGFDLAAAWAWRFLVLCAAAYVVIWLLARFAVVTFPLAVSLLVAALMVPGVNYLDRVGVPRKLASGVFVVGGVGFVGLLLTFVGQQISQGAVGLADQVVQGISEIEGWLKSGPLNASDSQINTYLESIRTAISDRAQDPQFVTQITHFGTAIGHVVAGFFIVLFASYFLLADGDRIWAWFVRLMPRASRREVNSSGRVAWVSLTQFVRATVLVAMADSAGIMLGAGMLQVPFVLAIGVLVFLGAFVPMIGATIAGSVAVLVALVSQGPWTALFMLGVVILVQQIEGHVLQPFLMGSFVSVHPLGVIVAIGCGVLIAGVAGALIAVPLAAAGNAVAQHLADVSANGPPDPEPPPPPPPAAGLDDATVPNDAAGPDNAAGPDDAAGAPDDQRDG